MEKEEIVEQKVIEQKDEINTMIRQLEEVALRLKKDFIKSEKETVKDSKEMIEFLNGIDESQYFTSFFQRAFIEGVNYAFTQNKVGVASQSELKRKPQIII